MNYIISFIASILQGILLNKNYKLLLSPSSYQLFIGLRAKTTVQGSNQFNWSPSRSSITVPQIPWISFNQMKWLLIPVKSQITRQPPQFQLSPVTASTSPYPSNHLLPPKVAPQPLLLTQTKIPHNPHQQLPPNCHN